MATYTPSSGRLICTGSDITAAGIKAAIDANPSVGTASSVAAGGGVTFYQFNAEINIGDGSSTVSVWNLTRDFVQIAAAFLYVNGSGAEFRIGNTSSGISIDGAAFIFVGTSGATDRFQVINGAKWLAYGSFIRVTDSSNSAIARVLPAANVTIKLVDCDLELEDGVGDNSTGGVMAGLSVDYSNSRIHNTSAVGLKLYNAASATLENVKIQQCTYGIQSGNAVSVTLRNVKIDSCTYHLVAYAGSFTITFVNPDFLTLRALGTVSGDTTNIEFVCDITVQNFSGAALQDARIFLKDAQNSIRLNGLTAASGKVAAFGETFQNSTWDSLTKTDRALHTIKVRKFGYVFAESTRSAVANNIESIRVLTNAAVAASDATASAYTGVAINGAGKTITLSSARSLQELYDYSQAWGDDSGNIQYDESITSTDGANFTLKSDWMLIPAGYLTFGSDRISGGIVRLDAAGTHSPVIGTTTLQLTAVGVYQMGAADIAGTVTLTNTSGGAITVELPAGTSYVNSGPSITVSLPTVTRGLSLSSLVAGSTVRVFDTGTQTVIFETTSSGTSESWSESASGSRTLDYTVYKDGYSPIRVPGVVITGAISGGIQTVSVSQEVDRAFVASTGLTYGTTATVNTTTKLFALTAATTGQNWYSFWCEQYRNNAALYNKPFPLQANGPNSFTLRLGYEFSSGLTYMTKDGIRYVDASGTNTAQWAAVLSIGVPAGLQVRYQQVEGSAPTNASNTGNIDQLIQVYGDATHGNFDYRGFMVCKVQADGYDQAEFDLVATFGSLEDQLYVAGLTPTANGIAAGSVTGVSITDHGASPVTWNSKSFSITITDTTGHTGEQIMQYVRGLNSFNYHDLVQTNGTEFKTVRGKLYGDTGASLKGVRVVQADGTTSHADFNLHTADDGTTYIPPLPPASAEATILADSRVQLFNVTTDTEIDNTFIVGTSYSYVITSEAAAGDVLRLRVCKLGKEAGEAFAVWGASGATFLIAQPASAEYDTWGIDGSTVTEFSGDVTGHIYIDANDLDGVTTKTRLGAWYSWVLTTEIGIRHFFGAVTCVSTAAIRINVDIADILIENINASTALRFTDLSVRLYRSDGSSVIAPTSYSIHNDYSGVPDVVETGVSGLTGSESAQLMALPSSSAIVSAVSAAVIPVDMVKVKGQTISGSGSEADPWGP